MPETAKTPKCPDDIDFYNDVTTCRGDKSLPGIRPYVYMTRRANIVTWPTYNGDPVKLEDLVVLTGDFVLASDKKWIKIELASDVGKINPEQVGGEGSEHFKNKVVLAIPGTEEKATGLIAAIAGDDVVFLVPQRNGKFRLMGNEEFRCALKTSQDTGEGHEDKNVTSIEVEVYDRLPAPFYPGKILTNDGEISGATGKPIVPGGVGA